MAKNPANVKRGRNNKKRGASVEREVAKLFGTVRNIDRGGKFGDIQTNSLVIEVKSRQQVTPKLISGAWDQALEAAAETGKDPLVVLVYAAPSGKRRFWAVKEITE